MNIFMKFKLLGNTDLKVSLICLGTMTWGEQNTQSEAFEQMDFSLDNGVNFFDTAEYYSVKGRKETYGSTEKIIGNWFKQNQSRDKVVLATKVAGPDVKWIRDGGLQFNKKNFSLALEGSLKRLQTDYIDLYQLHWPERNVPIFGNFDYEHDENEKKWTPIEEILFTLNKYIKKKIIKNYGLSNETSWGLMKFLYEAKKNKIKPPVSIQNPYNLINRVFDISLSEISLRENCGLLAYSPLAGGRLSGKYLKKNKSQNTRFTLWPGRFDRHFTKKGELAIEKYINLSHKYKINPILLAHSFVLSRPFLTSSIMGVSDLDQLKQNIKSIDFLIENNILKKINEIHEEDRNPCV